MRAEGTAPASGAGRQEPLGFRRSGHTHSGCSDSTFRVLSLTGPVNGF